MAYLEVFAHYPYDPENPPVKVRLSSIVLPEGIKPPRRSLCLSHGFASNTYLLQKVTNQQAAYGMSVASLDVSVRCHGKFQGLSVHELANAQAIKVSRLKVGAVDAVQEILASKCSGDQYKRVPRWQLLFADLTAAETLFGHPSLPNLEVLILNVPNPDMRQGAQEVAMIANLDLIEDIQVRGLDVTTIERPASLN